MKYRKPRVTVAQWESEQYVENSSLKILRDDWRFSWQWLWKFLFLGMKRCNLISIHISEELLSRSSGWNGRDYLGDMDVNGRDTAIKNYGVWRGRLDIWLVTGFSGRLLWEWWWICCFQKPRKFLTSWATMRFWRSLLYGDSWNCSASEVTDNAQWVELFRLDLPSFRSTGPHCLSQRPYLLITVFSANGHVTMPKVPFNART